MGHGWVLLPMLLWVCVALLVVVPAGGTDQCKGSFRIMGDVGISSITMSQSIDGRVYLMDRRDLQNSKINMSDGTFAHAVEYTIANNTWRPIKTVSNTWCSSGGYMKDGTILNSAGNDAGLTAIRLLRPCSVPYTGYLGGYGPRTCDEWWEDSVKFRLNRTRWYPTSQVLPDGRHFVVGGSNNGQTSPAGMVPNYEFIDLYSYKTGRTYNMSYLLMKASPNYLYPFVHLLPCDLLFIYANLYSIIYDYKTARIVMENFPIPDGLSRTYPSTASSLLLPLTHETNYTKAEILICGGNQVNAFVTTRANQNCWIINVSNDNIRANNTQWRGPYDLARPRCMPDLLYLMDGSILIINGVFYGVAGYQTASGPNLGPEVLRLNTAGGIDIDSNYCNSTITRGYHSEAILTLDGRVFLAGSNPNNGYNNNPNVTFRTEYRVEFWTPQYKFVGAPFRTLDRPTKVAYNTLFTFGMEFTRFSTPKPTTSNTRVAFISNAFVTHSLSMNLRYVTVSCSIARNNFYKYTLTCLSPPSAIIAPAGPYIMAVTYQDAPADSTIWVFFG